RPRLRDMREQFPDWRDSFGFVPEARKSRGHSFEEIFGVAQKEIILITIVRVKGRAAHASAIENILHGDIIKRFLHEQVHQRIPESGASASHTSVFLFAQVLQVSGHWVRLCSVSACAHPGQLTNRSLKLRYER